MSLDDNNYAKTTYQIVDYDSKNGRDFLLTEKEPQSNFTVNMKAINYDPRYYENDGLFFGLALENNSIKNIGYGNESIIVAPNLFVGYDDKTHLNIDNTSKNIVVITNLLPSNYTKSAWVKISDTSGIKSIISSTEPYITYPADTQIRMPNTEFLAIVNGNLECGHDSNNFILSHPYPNDGNWHFVAVSYDIITYTRYGNINKTSVMKLYLDGKKVNTISSLEQRNLTYNYSIGSWGGLYNNNFLGKISQPQYYSSVLTDDIIKELYFKYN